MCCVSLVTFRALSFQRLVLIRCGLPGHEARRKKLGGNEREKRGLQEERGREIYMSELRGLCHGNCIK